MAANTRTSPAKRTLPKPADAPKPAASFEPIRVGRKKKPADEGVPLFYLTGDDGEEIEYRIPSKVPTSLSLEYLRLARTMGENAAAQRMLERLLGLDAYLALEQSNEVDEDDMESILQAVISHVAGPVDESGKGRA
ncbi:hypothetical protein GCM10010193_70570 [Kitasatospora atroaurantiaca]|uniref:Uncharacterized protein n=1 Tax=Kitasatospora atroaurantiaca TaxID=285545 RepID=A0A561ENE4_9ACTN|nr:hypothetical protein [Kitasatospora atroaurantiaca]TWE17143.1 hypothetical protein FB465_2148 [Kitasatospora atroaurantiaca]